MASDPGITRLLDAVLDLVFPHRCAGCGRMDHVWCERCDRELRILPQERGICRLCGGLLIKQAACRSCSLQPLPLKVRSYALYQRPLKRAILRLKYRPDRALGNLMAGWLAQLYYRNHWSASLIVPVPLADGRLKTRGYNQASLITNALGTALRIPQSESALKRVRETPSQVGMEQVERRQNVMGAFRASAEQVQGRQILLVDDLYTTGATLTACTEALIEAGAEQVLGLTVGRAWS